VPFDVSNQQPGERHAGVEPVGSEPRSAGSLLPASYWGDKALIRTPLLSRRPSGQCGGMADAVVPYGQRICSDPD
jgi:hypothetical protein